MSLKARRMYFFFFFISFFFMHNLHACSCSQPIGQQGLDHMNCRLTQFLYCFCRLRVTFTLNYFTPFTEMINLKRKSRSQAVFHKKGSKCQMTVTSNILNSSFADWIIDPVHDWCQNAPVHLLTLKKTAHRVTKSGGLLMWISTVICCH